MLNRGVRLFKRRKPEDPPTVAPLALAPLSQPVVATASGEGSHLAAEPTNASPTSPVRRPDPGFGVPPFRPDTKEAPAMGRSPFTAPPAPPSSTPAPGMATLPGGGIAAPPRPGVQPNRSREPAERRTLVVGRGISVQGTVTDAERLVVEGTVEASMIHAAELVIAVGGIFKGEVEVEDTEIAGTIDGTLTARGNLIVRSTGRVLGTARCRRLQVEDGGQITGRIEMITEPARTDTPRPANEPAVAE